MYRCDLNILLLNMNEAVVMAIKEVEPREWFSHNFICENSLKDGYEEKIDIVIFRDNGTDCINRIRLVLGEALCIYCTDRASELSCQELEQLHDIWPEKLVPATAKLLFTRLLDNEKLKKDAWLWNTELEAVIDTSLDLIWFKGRFGEHWRVNNAFCDTVKKTKEDIRGKQHYYIWDLTPEEYEDGQYVCIETEQDVKLAGHTCRYREQVKGSSGMKELLTYKTPLYDKGNFIGTVGVAKDITKEEAYRKKLLQQAQTDELTGLANRRYFYYSMQKMDTDSLAVIYLDLDSFKQLNDEYGHQAGDAALAGFATLLQASFADGIIARMGGDEFVVALQGEYTKEEMCQKLDGFMEKMRAFFAMNHEFKNLSVSIGVLLEKNNDGQVDVLLHKSDEAMYTAKKSGKNRYCFYEDI